MSIEKEARLVQVVLERAVGVIGTQTAREVGHTALDSIEQKYRELEHAWESKSLYPITEQEWKIAHLKSRLSLYEAVVEAAREHKCIRAATAEERATHEGEHYAVVGDNDALRSALQALDEEAK